MVVNVSLTFVDFHSTLLPWIRSNVISKGTTTKTLREWWFPNCRVRTRWYKLIQLSSCVVLKCGSMASFRKKAYSTEWRMIRFHHKKLWFSWGWKYPAKAQVTRLIPRKKTNVINRYKTGFCCATKSAFNKRKSDWIDRMSSVRRITIIDPNS